LVRRNQLVDWQAPCLIGEMILDVFSGNIDGEWKGMSRDGHWFGLVGNFVNAVKAKQGTTNQYVKSS